VPKKTVLKRYELDLERLQFDVERLQQCRVECRNDDEASARDHNRLQQMKRQNHQLDFQYTSPTANFDRTRHVHGLVATLFNINDRKYAQALELTAGGKLFHVVVDTDETSNSIDVSMVTTCTYDLRRFLFRQTSVQTWRTEETHYVRAVESHLIEFDSQGSCRIGTT
jgi:hypothetical protein